MKIRFLLLLTMIVAFLFSACSITPNDTTKTENTTSKEKSITEISFSDTVSQETNTVESENDEDSQNPGASLGYFKYNDVKYNRSPLCTRFVMDSDGEILEPKNDGIDECISYVYALDKCEYIGNGDKIGWGDEKTKLYLSESENVIAIYPYQFLENDFDKEEILSKYDADMIYGATLLRKAE